MKINKIFMTIMMLLILVGSVFGAEDIVTKENSNVGDVDGWKAQEQQSLWNKITSIFSGGGSFSSIDGASCSTQADYSKDYTPSTSSITQLCHTNNDHIGVVFKLFDLNVGWLTSKNLDVAQGEKKCFNVVYGTPYHYKLYYCDSTSQRTCTDSDGGKDITKKGTVTFTIDGRTETFTDTCNGNDVVERYCDSDNTVMSESITCEPGVFVPEGYGCSEGVCKDLSSTNTQNLGQICTSPSQLCYNAISRDGQVLCDLDDIKYCVCSNDKCVNDPAPVTQSIGINIETIEITNSGNLVKGQVYEIKGTAKITGKCEGCVIETGLEEYGSSYSILSTSSSGACGDDRTVGVKFNAEDEYVTFTLRDTASKTGRYRVNVYASNSCYTGFESTFRLLDTDSYTLSIEDVPEITTITCYYCSDYEAKTVESRGTTCTGILFPTEPNCEPPANGGDDPVTPQLKTCYYCAGTELRTSLAETCTGETSSTKLDCTNNQDKNDPPVGSLVQCYYCAGKTLRQITAPSPCKEGTSADKLTCGDAVQPNCANNPGDPACNGGENCDSAVYTHDNPNECLEKKNILVENSEYFIGGGLLLLIIGMVGFFGLKKKGKRR